mgnify:CR=1 FL=1
MKTYFIVFVDFSIFTVLISKLMVAEWKSNASKILYMYINVLKYSSNLCRIAGLLQNKFDLSY